ncbi:MAG: 4a-hydroxytetrahydrobiopterin dehydratase [Planctomycetota bacterium]|jgi:4a-hydroxytetrahydrobiopterin dehydratase
MTDLATMQRAIQAWVERADGDLRCKALWLEGPTPAAIRRHTGAVDLHLGVEEPDFDHFTGALPDFLAAAGAVQRQADGPTEPDAFALVAEVEGVGAVTFTLERMSLIGKRPRSAVQPLFDRTGRLRNVMDYSGARRPAAPKEEPVAPHPDLLSRDVVAAALSRLPNWKRHGNEILATYRLRKFLSGVTLAGKVALAAEAANHHPDILIRFREVSFSLTTHEAGGLTQKDLDLAAQIEGLAEEVQRGRAAAPATKAKKKAKKKAAPKTAKKAKKAKTAKKAKKKKAAAKKAKKPAKKKAAKKPAKKKQKKKR